MPFKRDQELINQLKHEQERIRAATVLHHDAADPSLKAYFGIEAEVSPAEMAAQDLERLHRIMEEAGATPGPWPRYRDDEVQPSSPAEKSESNATPPFDQSERPPSKRHS
jgi:hypothetical protein